MRWLMIHRITEQARRARKLAAPGTATVDQVLARFAYFGNRCVYCRTTERLTVDHVVPLSRGGSHWPANLRPACISCNSRKGARRVVVPDVGVRSLSCCRDGLARWFSDTCHANLDLGFAIYLYGHDLNGKPVFSLRIWGINAPELSDPSGSGKAALAYAEQICPPGTHVTVVSHGFDKYGSRADCTITLGDGSDFATLMLAAGQAVVMT
jgi:hypothetical protein